MSHLLTTTQHSSLKIDVKRVAATLMTLLYDPCVHTEYHAAYTNIVENGWKLVVCRVLGHIWPIANPKSFSVYICRFVFALMLYRDDRYTEKASKD